MSKIPKCVDEIDVDWFASVLKSRFPGIALKAARQIRADSGTTGRAFFALEWEASPDRTDLPKRVFLKLPPTDEVQRASNAAMGMGKREAQFYDRLSPEIPVLAPTTYYSDWSDDATNYIMVLEDLTHTGGKPLALGSDNQFELAQQLVASLARLHRKYWNTDRFHSDLNWVGPYTPIRNPEPPLLVDRTYNLFKELMPPIFKQARDLFVERQHALADLFEQGIPTLVHGDCHMSNLYLDKHQKLGFLDWAIVSKMPAMWDVAYGLCLSFPPDVRKQAEKQLLPVYVALLNESDAINVSLEEIQYEYRKFAFFSWISAATTLGAGERMQPLEWSLSAIRWTTQAIEDLNVLEVLQRELKD